MNEWINLPCQPQKGSATAGELPCISFICLFLQNFNHIWIHWRIRLIHTLQPLHFTPPFVEKTQKFLVSNTDRKRDVFHFDAVFTWIFWWMSCLRTVIVGPTLSATKKAKPISFHRNISFPQFSRQAQRETERREKKRNTKKLKDQIAKRKKGLGGYVRSCMINRFELGQHRQLCSCRPHFWFLFHFSLPLHK